ncbi:ABC transporter ATP-binding protein [Rosenbergiella epipactidis]|uniref:ABC transporter ATP-binding protein n=1 Tax=Rosenbergiella epipactidis TaxID=1544694 RepID=UPI001F4D813A|nr:ABC transporter ATP-binding protein [Rosenbergiella epipactidis]
MSFPLATENLCAGYDKHQIIHDVTLTIPAQKTTIIVGANGSGKSTLLHTLAGLNAAQSGKVLLEGSDLSQRKRRDIAKRMSFLAQSSPIPDAITVSTLVARGRYPWQGLLHQWSRQDEQAVDEALQLTGLSAFRDYPVAALSGGQRQRCWIAMTLAQQTALLLLDEPTTYLDLRYQVDVLTLLQTLTQQHNKTVVMVLHDLNFALHFADRLLFVKAGKVIAELDEANDCTAELIEETFGVRTHLVTDPRTQKPIVIPLWAANAR